MSSLGSRDLGRAFDHMLTGPGLHPLPEIIQVATISLSSKSDKNSTPLGLGQSKTHAVSHLEWQPLPEITKMATISLSSNISFLEWFIFPKQDTDM